MTAVAAVTVVLSTLAPMPVDPVPLSAPWPADVGAQVAEHPPIPECIAFAAAWPHVTEDLCMAVYRSDLWGEPIRLLFARAEWGTAAAVVACESMGNPNARGGGGWQFTTDTARQYGLVDAANPVASTAAAARMLDDRGTWVGWACWACPYARRVWERWYEPHGGPRCAVRSA